MTLAEYAFYNADYTLAVMGAAGAFIGGTATFTLLEGALFAIAAAFFTLVVASLRPPNSNEPWRGPHQ